MLLQNEIAKDLLKIEAVQIKTNRDDYFTWTSGIKSPIYCDNRLTMSYPDVRKKIVAAFEEKIAALTVKPDVVAGCATAGIPHAAWLAEALDLPMVYVRSKPKGHGKGNQIEGKIGSGQKVLVIEDLISTGGSSLDTASVLKQAGAEVLAVFAIFTYGMKKAKDAFETAEIAVETITSFDHLTAVMQADGALTEKERQQLILWRNNL
jgi:orotate phosphoribosyltransferase